MTTDNGRPKCHGCLFVDTWTNTTDADASLHFCINHRSKNHRRFLSMSKDGCMWYMNEDDRRRSPGFRLAPV